MSSIQFLLELPAQVMSNDLRISEKRILDSGFHCSNETTHLACVSLLVLTACPLSSIISNSYKHDRCSINRILYGLSRTSSRHSSKVCRCFSHMQIHCPSILSSPRDCWDIYWSVLAEGIIIPSSWLGDTRSVSGASSWPSSQVLRRLHP